MGLDMMMYREHQQTNKSEPNYDDLEEIAYWRKFNALHNWFVRNVQDNIDDCNYYKLTRDILETLLDILKYIKDNSDDLDYINENLPPTAGFFFGSTDIDEYFIEDIVNTYDKIYKILNGEELQETFGDGIIEPVNFEIDTLYYISSW